jgi:Pyridoxamine 5'-phosphate oxidase
VLESAALAHLVTLNEDGSPQVSIVWVGLDGDEIVAGPSRSNSIRRLGRLSRPA